MTALPITDEQLIAFFNWLRDDEDDLVVTNDMLHVGVARVIEQRSEGKNSCCFFLRAVNEKR